MTPQNKFSEVNSKAPILVPQVNNWIEAKKILKRSLDIELTEEQEEKLQDYHSLLQETNKVINLTRLDSLSDFLTFHLVDTALLIPVIRSIDFKKNKELQYLDLGSGCGVPGIVLHILLGEIQTTLLDSISKRTRFLKKVIEELKLNSIKVITCRAESLIDKHKQFDLLTARAFAKPPVAMKMARPFLNKHGVFLAQTTETVGKNKQKLEYELAGKKRLVSVCK